MKPIRLLKAMLSLLFLCLLLTNACANVTKTSLENTHQAILEYISQTFHQLRRSSTECQSLIDPKTHLNSVLYLPADLKTPAAVQQLQRHCAISIKRLPRKIHYLGEVKPNEIETSGLLYLPHPYVVPGGMFNEMYGWDSYFIIRGLLEENQLNMAQGMIENFFFEIDHYGAILNANRTYYLSRSQPPFLTSMIRAFYSAAATQQGVQLAWLAKAYRYAIKDYQLWTQPPHTHAQLKLPRYYDFSQGPVPELDGSARFYYDKILAFFMRYPELAKRYTTSSFKSNGTLSTTLNNHFYKGDRAMRESGFDTSFRFGPFSADTTYYSPIELNSLLYKAEKDLEWMSQQLHLKIAEKKWHARALSRQRIINTYLWNEKKGLYYDYNIKKQMRSHYQYATTFFPLWVGLASPAQAKKIVKNLVIFEKKSGLVASPYQTGAQWDYPYTWAPLQLIAIEGLNQYGFRQAAKRLSQKYVTMIETNFAKEKTIHEKYNAIDGTSNTNIKVGYKENVTGFGWTNGVFLILLKHYASQEK